jgi:hypothetical protein
VLVDAGGCVLGRASTSGQLAALLKVPRVVLVDPTTQQVSSVCACVWGGGGRGRCCSPAGRALLTCCVVGRHLPPSFRPWRLGVCLCRGALPAALPQFAMPVQAVAPWLPGGSLGAAMPVQAAAPLLLGGGG